MARAEAEVVQQDNTLLRSWQHHLNQIFISWILGYQVKKKNLTWGGKRQIFFSGPIHILNLIFYVKSDSFPNKPHHFKTRKQMMMMITLIEADHHHGQYQFKGLTPATSNNVTLISATTTMQIKLYSSYF